MTGKKIIYVHTGEVECSTNEVILKSSAIGSCIVLAAYDIKAQIGGFAHIMLPGKAPENKEYQKTRYANDAIEEMISKMILSGGKNKNIELCLIGGANVLKRENDSIAKDNINSVFEILNQKKFKIKAESLGGMERRSASLDVESGEVYYTIGDSTEMHLYSFCEI